MNKLQPLVIKGYNDVVDNRPCAACGVLRSVGNAERVRIVATTFLTIDQASFVEQILNVQHIEDLCSDCLVRGMASDR